MTRVQGGGIVVLDRTGDFLWLEDGLQSSSSPYPVIAFDDLSEFRRSLEDHQKACPWSWLIVIADSDARYPSPEKGAFAVGSTLVRHFSGIAYTTNTEAPEWKTLEPKRIVARARPDSLPNLRRAVGETIAQFAEPPRPRRMQKERTCQAPRVTEKMTEADMSNHAFFETNGEAFLRQYPGECLAFCDGSLQSHHRDPRQLALEMATRFPGRRVLIVEPIAE